MSITILSLILFFIFLSWIPSNGLELFEFSSAEKAILDVGMRRPPTHKDSAVKLISFTEEEEAALGAGWLGAKTYGKAVSSKRSRIPPEEYCNHYRSNYAYYCIETNYGNEPLIMKIAEFCPIYKSKCMAHARTVEKDPFHVLQQRVSPDFPDVQSKAKEVVVSQPQDNSDFEDISSKSEGDVHAEERLEALKKRFPCTPKCDQRVFPHCTKECKCDYEYPRVQRFCNPPPLPFFLNTCRLWYYGCPKYQQYHYSSQFVYSKANKGKTIGGAASGTTGVGSPAAAVAPVATSGFGGGSSFGGGGGLGGGFSSSSGVSTPFGGFGMGSSFGVG